MWKLSRRMALVLRDDLFSHGTSQSSVFLYLTYVWQSFSSKQIKHITDNYNSCLISTTGSSLLLYRYYSLSKFATFHINANMPGRSHWYCQPNTVVLNFKGPGNRFSQSASDYERCGPVLHSNFWQRWNFYMFCASVFVWALLRGLKRARLSWKKVMAPLSTNQEFTTFDNCHVVCSCCRATVNRIWLNHTCTVLIQQISFWLLKAW